MSRLAVCPRCKGEGLVAIAGRRPLARCPHCAGEGVYRGRPYGQARHCDRCGRVYNPPLHPDERQARWCIFCRDRPAPESAPKSATPTERFCWLCGRTIHPLPVGRPRRFCEVCRPYRQHQRRYRPRRTAVATS